jgi:anaerobic magnesium-protoporphyrin IX monomethyl ester cyclase
MSSSRHAAAEMKVVLFNPPTKTNKKFIREGRCTQEQGVWATLWPPISLAMIGAVLEQEGHDVCILDCPAEGIGWALFKKTFAAFSPGLALWSTGTPSIESDLSIAADIKEINPAILTGVFGTHVTVLDRECLEHYPAVDVIIRHEPELTIRDLAAALQRGTCREDIAGITFRNASGEITATPARPFIEDLDSLPFPAWHLINSTGYTLPMKGRPFLILAPQRGCPFNCSFCTCQTYYGNKLRKRSIDHVLAELEYDISRFNVRDFFIWSETFVVDKNYVADLCRAICDRRLAISWTCNSRIDIVDENLLRLMAKAGCWMISYGIESGEQSILDGAAKGTRIEQAYTAVRLARKAGIKTAGHFIFGLPGETKDSMEKTMAFSKKLGLDIAQFYCCVPFPGSRLYEQAVQEGWVKAQGFGGFSQGCAVMELPTVSSEVVNSCRNRAYTRFYARPSAWYKLVRMVEWGGLKSIWKTALAFMNWSGR